MGKDWDYSKTTLKYLYKFLDYTKYCFNGSQYEPIYQALKSNNKRAAIQKLIDNNIINYNPEMV